MLKLLDNICVLEGNKLNAWKSHKEKYKSATCSI